MKFRKNRKIENSSSCVTAKVSSSARIAAAIDFELLESRQMMTALSITDFGAVSGSGDSRTAFQAALNAARPGDTVSVPAGTFNISGALNVPTGVTITGLGSNSSHLNFTLTDGDNYGFVFTGNDANVTIENLDLHSAHGLIGMYYGSGYDNIHITNNALQFGGGQTSNGTDIFGIYGSESYPGLQITHNYFHDSLNSNRNWEIWNPSNANIDYNTFYNVADGGHIDDPGDNVSFSYNYGTQIHRMGQEIQGDLASHNLKVVGNTFYNWVTPYYDSFGMSIVNHNAINTLVADNYLGATIAPGSTWGIKDPNVNRFGYAIEIGAQSATVENNIMTGQWVAGVVSSRYATVENNQAYGSYAWGTYIGEGGLNGVGQEVLINNTQGGSLSSAPAAPANTNNYTGGTSSSTSSGSTTTTTVDGPTAPVTTPVTTPSTPVTTVSTPTVSANGINGLTVTVLSDTSVTLNWTNSGGLTDADVSIISTQGRQSFGTVTLPDGSTTATITGLHAGWELDFEVTGKNTAGAAVNSAVATAQMTGNGAAVNNSTPTLANALTTPTAPVTTPTAPVTTTTTTSNDVGANGMTGLTAIVLGDNSVKLSWTTSTTLSSAMVSIVTSVGRQTFIPVTVDGNVASVTIGNLHAGWQFDFSVTGTAADGSTVNSGVVTAQTTGTSSLALASNPDAIAMTTVASQAGPVAGTVSNITATSLSDTSLQLSWVDTDTDQASAQIGVVTTVGREVYPTISVSGGVTTATITGLHAGWQFDFTVTIVNSAGKSIVGGPVTVMTTGGSNSTTLASALKLSSNSVLLAA